MSTFDYKVNAAEVVYCFNNIINFDGFIRNTKSFCFEDIAGLVMGKF